MKTLLFIPMFLGHNKIDGEPWLVRNKKWIDYYIPLKEKLGYTEIFIVDNASNEDNLNEFKEYIKKYESVCEITIMEKKIHLPRLSILTYPYWYRAFAEAANYGIIFDFDKIISIDSDVFLFSDRICTYIKNTNTGWNTFWCQMHGFPESTIEIIGRDKFHEMDEFMSEGYLKFYPTLPAETQIPWTHVEKSFIGDRYGEKNLPQDPSWDYAGQCPNEMKVTFRG